EREEPDRDHHPVPSRDRRRRLVDRLRRRHAREEVAARARRWQRRTARYSAGVPWQLLAILGLGGGALILRALTRRSQQSSAAHASGLSPAADLSHLPEALQRTALWALADGGFERRVVHGQVPRERALIDVTAFDLETLRERRGEWAFLPVEPPFRIG